MTRQCVVSPNGPPAVGPYSSAVIANGFVFTSGQLALAPDGSGPRPGTIEEETELAMANLRAVLEDSGSGLGCVVKTTVYLTDMAEFQRFNAVYQTFFPSDPPARTCIQIAALPLGMRVEVEAIATVQGGA